MKIIEQRDKYNAAIVTFTDGANYGNRLQNYALQEILTEMGCTVTTMRLDTWRNYRGINYTKAYCKNILKAVLRNRDTQFVFFKRLKRFQRFNKENITKETSVKKNNLKNEKGKYQFFIAGSDQIWNTNFNTVVENLDFYMMEFAESSKRISYAASLGVSEFPEILADRIKHTLKGYNAISVRESDAAKYISEITGMQIQTVLDPTLLLSKEKWRKICKKPDYIGTEEKFVLTYFFSEMNDTLKEKIQTEAKRRQARIVNLTMEYLSDDMIADKDIYLSTPDEFLWLIEHAECVFTDSYHATVFCMIFDKAFVVYGRPEFANGNMQSRLRTLTSFWNGDIDDITKPQHKAERKKVKWDLIEEEKRKSVNFLRKSLDASQVCRS